MDLLQVVGLVALVAGVAALALVIELRGRLARLELSLAAAQKFASDLQSAHEAVHDELADLRSELQTTQRHLDRAQRELGELKATAEVLPAPPLPRARSGGLDDLREQLRAAHRERESTDEV
jgi:septal ring factor EnvC (AmiA/AmiB activator)